MIKPLYRNSLNFELKEPLLCDFNDLELYYIYTDKDNNVIIQNQLNLNKEINTLTTSITNFNILSQFNSTTNTFEIIYIFTFEGNLINRSEQSTYISTFIKKSSSDKYQLSSKTLCEISQIFHFTKEFILILNNNSDVYIINNNYYKPRINRIPKPDIKKLVITKTNKPEIYQVEDGTNLYIPNIHYSKILRNKINSSCPSYKFDCHYNNHFNKWQIL